MTEEEYQAKILEHETTINALNAQLETHKTNETTFTTEKETLNTEISKLKQHNMDLFLKLTDQQKGTNNINNNPPPKDQPKLNDILNTMLTKEK